MRFHKTKKYKLDTAQANQALQNIFAACDNKPNTIPFDKLILRQKMNTGKYDRLLLVTYIALFLTFISPLVIVPFATQTRDWRAPEAVAMIDSYVSDGYLYVRMEGDNIKEKTLCFSYSNDTESNIYIPVKDSSDFHLLLTPGN